MYGEIIPVRKLVYSIESLLFVVTTVAPSASVRKSSEMHQIPARATSV